ncbi:MAG: FMN-binding protein, partial [bacterium]
YESESRAQYINEPYWGQCKIIISNGEISEFEFRIIDKSCNEIFDENYEKHFAGNAIYINQCRNDLKGLKAYIKRFVATNNLNKVDAVSKATWSYNIFKDAVAKTLDKASKK